MRMMRVVLTCLFAFTVTQLVLADNIDLGPSSAGFVTRYTYDAGGSLRVTPICTGTDCTDTGTSTNTGRTYVYDYNEGTTTSFSPNDPADPSSSTRYDDAAGLVTRFTYDSTPYMATVDSIEVITSYDQSNHLVTQFRYDGHFDGPGPTGDTRFSYDSNPLQCSGLTTGQTCNLQTLYDDRGLTTTYAYDNGIQDGVLTPEPSSITLIASGIAGIAGLRRRFWRQ